MHVCLCFPALNSNNKSCKGISFSHFAVSWWFHAVLLTEFFALRGGKNPAPELEEGGRLWNTLWNRLTDSRCCVTLLRKRASGVSSRLNWCLRAYMSSHMWPLECFDGVPSSLFRENALHCLESKNWQTSPYFMSLTQAILITHTLCNRK